MKNYEFLLFDFDGTLVDYNKTEAWNLAATFRAAGLAYDKDIHFAAYQPINLRLWREFERGKISAERLRVQRFEEFFAVCGIQGDAHSIAGAYIENQGNAAFLFDDAISVLETLRPRYKMGIITNGLKEIQRKRLTLTGVDKYFDNITVSDEIGVQKPEAGIFEHCFRVAGHTDKTTALIIGDSFSADVMGGLNFGIDACWFNPTGDTPSGNGPGATYEIHSLKELPALLGI